MSNITYNHNDPIYESELHGVIKSIQKSIGDRSTNSVQQLAKSASFTWNRKDYIVSVNTIYNQAFVVPDIGNDDNTILNVYPRDNWKQFFQFMLCTKTLFDYKNYSLFYTNHIYKY